MSTSILRRALKSSPFVHKMLLPVVNLGRRVRQDVKERPYRKEMNRFRRHCVRLAKVLPEPVFVKVGANDGISSDPCSDILLSRKNWKGLLIEPVPYCFDRLKANFQGSRFSMEQVAIGAAPGQSTFYYVDPKAIEHLPGLPAWFDCLGSFDRGHIVKHLDGVLDPFIVESKVEVCPLSDILARNRIADIHLLQVDTEGHDFEVLKSLDFSKHAPLSIFVEHKHLSSADKAEMLLLLTKNGYSVADCGVDYFALHGENRRRLRAAA